MTIPTDARPPSPLDAMETYLKERLAEVPDAPSLQTVIAEAATDPAPRALMNRQSLPGLDVAAMAIMLARAKRGALAEALSLSAIAVNNRPPPPLQRFIRSMERQLDARREPLRDADGRPVVFVVSFPRSGNTRFMAIVTAAFGRARYTGLMSEGNYVAARAAQVAAKGPVFVKDHVMRADYEHNPIIYLVRDGRDCALSYNDFIARKRADDPHHIKERADSLRFVVDGESDEEGPKFSGWPAHVTDALKRKEAGHNVALVRYDELVGPGGYDSVAGAMEIAGVTLTLSDYERGVEAASERETKLRSAVASWKKDPIFPQGTMMANWLATAGASKWEAVLSASEKRRLHDAGYTDALHRAGFEADRNWWAR